MKKLNLGSGDKVIDGYANLDIKRGQSVFPLAIEDGSCDEIRASHILEHFSHRQTLEVLKNWARKLKPGGILKIAVPDWGLMSAEYTAGKKKNFLGYIMGGHVDENDYHKAIFDEESLTELMKAAGLDGIGRWSSEISDCASMDISLNLRGERSNGEVPGDAVQTKIVAVQSVPRLMFSDNMWSSIRAFYPLGIKLYRATGVFWAQGLTRIMEMHLNDGTEWIITLDYDTWFVKEHVERLCQLMAENPEADAIIPLQTKREDELPMAGLVDEKDQPRVAIDMNEFLEPLVPCKTGHFGLTIFRVSALKKLKRPWFMPKPDPRGSWGTGRLDEDIAFWHNFAASGCRAFLASEVRIVHLQMMGTVPGSVEENFKPIHCYISDLEEGRYPDGLVPKIERKK